MSSFALVFCPSDHFSCFCSHPPRFFFYFTSSIVFSHSSQIFLVSVHRSFGSQSISFNTVNVFFMWSLNPSGMLFTLYFGTTVLLVSPALLQCLILTVHGQYHSLFLVLFWQRKHSLSISCFPLHSLLDFYIGHLLCDPAFHI